MIMGNSWLRFLHLVMIICVQQTVHCQECFEMERRGPQTSTLCSHLESLCLGRNVQEFLVGMGEIRLTCPQPTPTRFVRVIDENPEGITIQSGGRYTIMGQTLTITNPQREDEGDYRCIVNNNNPLPLNCVVISGLARFATCDSGSGFMFNYLSTNIPSTRNNSCFETLNVTEGNITLDTRLMYGAGGRNCDCREDVTLLTVYKTQQYGISPLFNCVEETGSCVSRDGIYVMRHSTEHYDFSLILPVNVSDNDQQIFVEIEVKQPGESSRRMFRKFFNLTVGPAPPTTEPPMTSEPTGSTPAANTTLAIPSVDPAPLEPASAVGGAVGGVIGLLVAVVLVILLGVLLVYKTRRTATSDLKPDLETIDNAYQPQVDLTVGQEIPIDNRVSFCERNVVLPVQYESENSAKV